MKVIELTKGYKALVDDADYEALSQYRWHALDCIGRVIAVRAIYNPNGAPRRVYMHRIIANTPDGMETDHINGDTLDNRRANLRTCTHQENTRNAKPRAHSSKYKGVAYSRQAHKWIAQIRHNNKLIYLGAFDDEADAARAYDDRAIKLFGEFAYLNKRGEACLMM